MSDKTVLELLQEENERLRNKLNYIKRHIQKMEVHSSVSREALVGNHRADLVEEHVKSATLKELSNSVMKIPFVTITEFESIYEKKLKAEMYIFIGNPFWI